MESQGVVYLHPMKNTLGTRLKTSRLDAGYTQEGLGEAVGVTYEAVGQWERGKTAPSYGRLQTVSKALGVDPCWLAFGLGQSDNTLLDVPLMETILETVIAVLRSKKRQISPKKQAKLVTYLYQHEIQKTDKNIDKSNIAFLVDMIEKI